MKNLFIGVTTHRNSDGNHPAIQSVSESYTRSIQKAGGIPLLLPFGIKPKQVEAVVSCMDGILLTGGGDVSIERFGGKPHPSISGVDPVRDELEADVIRYAIQQQKPVFCICRGIQMLNVALGGTLFTDLHDYFSPKIKHNWWGDTPRDYLAHTVQITPGSKLNAILGEETIQVNSLHHQGIEKAAPNLRPIAYAPDGLVEAVEMVDYPFCLGVQWHPESMPDSIQQQTLFRAFLQAVEDSAAR